jgi:hypothetical protein
MTTTDDAGHVYLDVTREDGTHEMIRLAGSPATLADASELASIELPTEDDSESD